jgi:hypothetical protein
MNNMETNSAQTMSTHPLCLKIFIFIFQERLLLEPMFEVPGSNVKAVHIDEDTVRGKQTPRYEYHAEESDSGSSSKEETAEDSSQTEGASEGETSTGNSEDIAVEQSAAAKAKI